MPKPKLKLSTTPAATPDPTTETKPLPKMARAAFDLLGQQFQAELAKQVESLAQSALEDAGLLAADGWRVDANAGVFTRTVPQNDTP